MVNLTSAEAGARGGVSIAAAGEQRLCGKDLEKAEDDLFGRWGDHADSFVRDGAMPKYADAPRKVLFVLKEVSSDFSKESSDGVADLRKASSRDWSEGSGRWRPTWYAILRWSAALVPQLHWEGDIKPEVWQRVLGQIAVANLKKTPGGTAADHGEIERFVRENPDRLKEQLSLYKPHFTLCGSDFVADCLALLYGWTENDWRRKKRGRIGDEIWELDSPVLGRVISFWHPNQRSRTRSDLVDMLEEIEADWVKDLASDLGATREREVGSQGKI